MEKVIFSKLDSPDRIEILKHLAVDISGVVDMIKFDAVANSDFQEFYTFCNDIFENRLCVKNISMTIRDDEIIYNMQI